MSDNSTANRKSRNPLRGVYEAQIRARVAANRLARLNQQRSVKHDPDPEDVTPPDHEDVEPPNPEDANALTPVSGPRGPPLVRKRPRSTVEGSGQLGSTGGAAPRHAALMQQPGSNVGQDSTSKPATLPRPASIQRTIADNVAAQAGGFYALQENLLQRSVSDSGLATSPTGPLPDLLIPEHNPFPLHPVPNVQERRGSIGLSPLNIPIMSSPESTQTEREHLPGSTPRHSRDLPEERGPGSPSTLVAGNVQSDQGIYVRSESPVGPTPHRPPRLGRGTADHCVYEDSAECLLERFRPIRERWLQRFQAVANVRAEFPHRFCFLGLAMQFRDRTLTWRLLANKMRPLYARLIGRSYNRFPNVASILCKKHFPSGSTQSTVVFPMAKAILIQDRECARGIVESRLFDIEQHDEIITQSHRCGNGDCQDLHSVLQTLYENRTGRDGRCLSQAVLDYLSGKGVAEHCSEPSHRADPCLLRRMVERRFAPSGTLIKESACFWRKKIEDLSPEEIGTRFRVIMNDLVLPTSELTSYDYSYMVWQEDNPEPHLPEIRYLSLPPLTEKLVSIHALVQVSFMGENWDEYIASLP